MHYNNRIIRALIVSLPFLSACNDCSDYLNNGIDSENIQSVKTVKVSVIDFIHQSRTRSNYVSGDTNVQFQWEEGDIIGIFPIGGDQVKFPISELCGTESASFDGGAWALRSSYQYAAYYPFSDNNYEVSQTAIPVKYSGQKQNGLNPTKHLGAYDYLASKATSPNEEGGIDLQMEHLGALVCLQLNMPQPDSFSSITLESDGSPFITTGTFDLTKEDISITKKTSSSTFSIGLSNVSTTTPDETISCYFMLSPVSLSNSNIKITVNGSNQTTYSQTIKGVDIVAGHSYTLAIQNCSGGTMNNQEYVDLGLTNSSGKRILWATNNIGVSQSNSYGLYFAWGETKGHGQTDTTNEHNYSIDGSYRRNTYDWNHYKWCDGPTYNYLTKYNSESRFGSVVDNLFQLESEDDAASQNWQGKWRTPTHDEMGQLRDGCYWEWTSNYNKTKVSGYIVYKVKNPEDARKDSYNNPELSGCYSLNDTHIFLPASGHYEGDDLYGTGEYGYYWTSTTMQDYPYFAYTINFNRYHIYKEYYGRDNGISVRPVWNYSE